MQTSKEFTGFNRTIEALPPMGWPGRTAAAHDRRYRAVYRRCAFVTSRPGQSVGQVPQGPSRAPRRLLVNWLASWSRAGTLDVLRHGLSCGGKRYGAVASFQPDHGMTAALKRYQWQRLTRSGRSGVLFAWPLRAEAGANGRAITHAGILVLFGQRHPTATAGS